LLNTDKIIRNVFSAKFYLVWAEIIPNKKRFRIIFIIFQEFVKIFFLKIIFDESPLFEITKNAITRTTDMVNCISLNPDCKKNYSCFNTDAVFSEWSKLLYKIIPPKFFFCTAIFVSFKSLEICEHSRAKFCAEVWSLLKNGVTFFEKWIFF